MAESNRQKVLELLKQPGNDECADCGAKAPQFASVNLGAFLCTACAGTHRLMGTHISRVRAIYLDEWDEKHVEALTLSGGNIASKEKFEANVPIYYRRPNESDAAVLREEWIRAKYERQEFVVVDRQIYQFGQMDNWLWKRRKQDARFYKRRFVLKEGESTLKYYTKEADKEPKREIRISDLNAFFAPEKIGNRNSMQLTFVQNGSTRNIFVHSDDGKTIVDWYNAIRCAKLQHLAVAFPCARELDLLDRLTRDPIVEGWVWKSGIRTVDACHRRWMWVDDRKLMYTEDPLAAFPKGEFVIGHESEGYSVRSEGQCAQSSHRHYCLTLKTPDRVYVLGLDREADRTRWVQCLQRITQRMMTPQELNLAVNLVRKRSMFGGTPLMRRRTAR